MGDEKKASAISHAAQIGELQRKNDELAQKNIELQQKHDELVSNLKRTHDAEMSKLSKEKDDRISEMNVMINHLKEQFKEHKANNAFCTKRPLGPIKIEPTTINPAAPVDAHPILIKITNSQSSNTKQEETSPTQRGVKTRAASALGSSSKTMKL